MTADNQVPKPDGSGKHKRVHQDFNVPQQHQPLLATRAAPRQGQARWDTLFSSSEDDSENEGGSNDDEVHVDDGEVEGEDDEMESKDGDVEGEDDEMEGEVGEVEGEDDIEGEERTLEEGGNDLDLFEGDNLSEIVTFADEIEEDDDGASEIRPRLRAGKSKRLRDDDFDESTQPGSAKAAVIPEKFARPKRALSQFAGMAPTDLPSNSFEDMVICASRFLN